MNPLLSRRHFLAHTATGLGSIALASLLGQSHALADARPQLATGLHHPARAKRIIQLFMNGGASQCDLFDYKPQLIARHGQPFTPGAGKRVEGSVSLPGPIMKSPFSWAQYGETGRWVSSALPHTAKVVDELAFLMAMTSISNVHGPASYLQNSGFVLPGFPCMGAWISYALGSERDNVPAFVALPDARGLPYNGRSAFTAGFLPANHQATIIRASSPQPIARLTPPATVGPIAPESRADGLALLKQLNAAHAAEHSGDSRLQARIDSYELAARMQLSASEMLDLSAETGATRRLYGLDEPQETGFARNCLLARRMIERGVRFVQVIAGMGGGGGNWDNHTDIPKELAFMARNTDRATAALLLDLKSRGLLEDTLLVWTTEFGRMPFNQQGSTGRDHNGGTFVSWFAGAGVKAGASVGQSDEWSWKAETNATTCYDFHATILHLLGIDHERLTFRSSGIDRRLTDVHGHVIRDVLS